MFWVLVLFDSFVGWNRLFTWNIQFFGNRLWTLVFWFWGPTGVELRAGQKLVAATTTALLSPQFTGRRSVEQHPYSSRSTVAWDLKHLLDSGECERWTRTFGGHSELHDWADVKRLSGESDGTVLPLLGLNRRFAGCICAICKHGCVERNLFSMLCLSRFQSTKDLWLGIPAKSNLVLFQKRRIFRVEVPATGLGPDGRVLTAAELPKLNELAAFRRWFGPHSHL